MDIYEYLKKDHKKVEDMFKIYKTATTVRNKVEIFELIKKELILHAYSETETFYKTLEGQIKNQGLIWHGEKEHAEIEEKLAQISQHTDQRADIDKLMQELEDLVKHHVKEEEHKIFDAAKKVLSETEAKSIKEKMHDLKEKMAHSSAAEAL